MMEDEMVGWHHLVNGHDFDKPWELVMDREAWRAAVHRVVKSQIQLGVNWTEHTCNNIYHAVGSVVSDSHGNIRTNEAVPPSVLVYWCSTNRSHSRCVVELVLETKASDHTCICNLFGMLHVDSIFLNDPILEKKKEKRNMHIWNILKWIMWYEITATSFPTY